MNDASLKFATVKAPNGEPKAGNPHPPNATYGNK
jgi:hypothetical protein